MSCVIWTIICITTYETTIDSQRKWDINIKTKTIERGNKNIMWVWKIKLSQ